MLGRILFLLRIPRVNLGIAISLLSRYEIRTNPSYTNPPSPTELYSAPVTCRKDTSHWMGGVLSIETGGSCPVNSYLHSGFLALQMIMDTTKIRVCPEDLFSLKP